MTLKKKDKKKYIKNLGYECPFCGYDNRHHHAEDLTFVEDGHIEQKIRCMNCSKCWMDEYHLKDVHELADDSVKPPKTEREKAVLRRAQDHVVEAWCRTNDIQIGEVWEYFWEQFFEQGTEADRQQLIFLLQNDPVWKCNSDRDAAAVQPSRDAQQNANFEETYSQSTPGEGTVKMEPVEGEFFAYDASKPQSTPSEVPAKKGPRPLCGCGSPLTVIEEPTGMCNYCQRKSLNRDD